MSRLNKAHTTVRSLSSEDFEVQLVPCPGAIVFDLQSRNFGCDGYPYRQHADAAIPLKEARRLRRLLSVAITAAERMPAPPQLPASRHERWPAPALPRLVPQHRRAA